MSQYDISAVLPHEYDMEEQRHMIKLCLLVYVARAIYRQSIERGERYI